MRSKALVIVLLLSIHSFGSEIPEAKEFHPELYTIQFTLAELPSDFEMETEAERQAFLNFSTLSPIERDSLKSDKIKRLQASESKYINFATIHTKPDETFKGKNGDVKGMFDSESSTLDIHQLNLPGYKVTKPMTIAVSSDEWMAIFFGGKTIDGKEKKYCMLIKSYPPKK